MITITVVHVTNDLYLVEDFFKSLESQYSGQHPYEVIARDYGFSIMNRVSEKNHDSEINIHLPNNCLVLANSWDRYIDYMLKNGLPLHHQGTVAPTWKDHIIKKMGLLDRGHSGIFPEVDVEIGEENNERIA